MYPNQINNLLNEFIDEDPKLVILANKKCIKLFGESLWNTIYEGNQVDAIMCWIDGYKSKEI